MTSEQIISAIGLVGIGGLLKTGFDFLIANKKLKSESKQDFKEKRYKAIILMCYALVYYEKEGTTLTINRPDINSIDRLKNELSAEFINMSLYASDDVIREMRKFIDQQNEIALNNIAMSMRKDLYGIRTKLKSDVFKFEIE